MVLLKFAPDVAFSARHMVTPDASAKFVIPIVYNISFYDCHMVTPDVSNEFTELFVCKK